MPLALSLSVDGNLNLDPRLCVDTDNTLEVTILQLFLKNSVNGLLHLSATKADVSSYESLAYFVYFSTRFLENKRDDIAKGNEAFNSIPFVEQDWVEYLMQSPPMLGVEYLKIETFQTLWDQLNTTLNNTLKKLKLSFSDYLNSLNPDWQKIGRVCFHLAENKNNPQKPFAFMATYTSGYNKETVSLQHIPLAQALKEYAGDNNKAQLIQLLTPVQRASQSVEWVKNQLDTQQIFIPQPWSTKQAYAFLKSVSALEDAGLLIRIPNWWRVKNPPAAKVSVSVGTDGTVKVGAMTLLSFDVTCALPNGTVLSASEIQDILSINDPLVQIKGEWVHVDREKLSAVLDHWRSIEKDVRKNGLTFAQGLRLMAGASKNSSLAVIDENIQEWSTIIEGKWLKQTLEKLKKCDDPFVLLTLKKYLKATLRGYQMNGVEWLWMLYQLGMGGCLADDMGLGKTMQLIALMILIKEKKTVNQPHLLIVPASLVANWQKEIQTFAPHLKFFIAHSMAGNMTTSSPPHLENIDLVITTYGSTHRIPWMKDYDWSMIVLDEAQNIKNPETKQTQCVKKLKGTVRFILTGTPVENRLQDLWSLFDFCAPGLLGSLKEFANFTKKTRENLDERKAFYGVVRKLVSPYILRRLKTDKTIISDLPDKTEMDTTCFLSKKQMNLYQKSVDEFKRLIGAEDLDAKKRSGLVLSYLTRFKQICNHPAQFLGHGEWHEEDSGKYAQLRDICETIAQKQEKVLIFTQYSEIIPHLYEFLVRIFEQDGLILDGKTPVKERQNRVNKFQNSAAYPFFILSLKAGGTGLTLTKASHVIHFDRWWNPAVENQATDRAYRIGQKQNVLVHKFICQGTLEEKINAMIHSKKEMAENILQNDEETSLTQLSNDEILNLISLDIHKITQF
ncbi:MAG: RNA polymerase-associated protein RapA [Holosporales bacterium]